MQKNYESIANQLTGRPLVGAQVTIQNYPSLTAATVYATNDLTTPLTQPLTVAADGSVPFYAPDGHYQYTVNPVGGAPYVIPDILFEDIGIVSIEQFGIKGDGSDETTKIQNAINTCIADGIGCLLFPSPPVNYSFGDLFITGQFSMKGLAPAIPLVYLGSGTAISVSGSSGNRLSRMEFANFDLSPSARRTGTGISVNYADALDFRGMWLRKFTAGSVFTNTTGMKLYSHHAVDNQTGVLLSTNSGGGFGWFGGTADSNQLGLDINTNSNGMYVGSVEFDTDAYGLNGASSQGAYRVIGGAARVTFESINHTAQAVPTLGATVLLDGSATDILFINPHFGGGSLSPAAISIANASGVCVLKGRTTGHTTSSIIDSGAGAGDSLFINTDFAETTKFSGAGASNPVWINAITGALGIRLGRAIKVYASDDSASAGFFYSSGYLHTGDDADLAGAAKIAGSGKALGFYGITPVARQLLATGAAHTVDDVITALQNLGLLRQS